MGLPATLRSAAALLPGVALVLLPKCPICIAAYLSGFSALGLEVWAPSVIAPAVWSLLAVSLVFLFVRAARRSYWGPFAVAAAGALALALARMTLWDTASYVGMAVFTVGVLWSARRAPGPDRAACHGYDEKIVSA